VSWSGALVDDVVIVAMVDQQHPSRAHALLKVLERFPKNKTVRILFTEQCAGELLLDVLNGTCEMSKRVAKAHNCVKLQTLDVFSQGQPVGLFNHCK
jgi:hypothetical protein